MVRKCVLPNCIIKIDRYYYYITMATKERKKEKSQEKRKYAMHVCFYPSPPISNPSTPSPQPLKATRNAQDNNIFQKNRLCVGFGVCQSSYILYYDLFFIIFAQCGI